MYLLLNVIATTYILLLTTEY